MKNIEKYNETKCALDAYNQSKSNNIPFDAWLELEYKEPSMQTLLEAAETVTTIWKSKPHEGSLTNFLNAIVNLEEVIEREKKKPVRNFDKYKKVDEAFMAFKKMCCGTGCSHCRFREFDTKDACSLAWLYEEAEKEKDDENE